MGFSVNLPGRTAHEALLNRQDAELRLLETIKRCIANKVKCDREWAQTLSSVASAGNKIDRSEDLSGSIVVQTWKSVMEELDNVGKLVKANSDLIEKETLDKLSSLCSEKRKAKKMCQEEHNRITLQFSNLLEEVAKKKADYNKHLEFYKLMRSRFEEHYVKSGRGGRKLDDVREKYQRACRRLHLVHNEYVLLVAEAAESEKDFRTVLLPGLLEKEQKMLQNFVATWKSVFSELIEHWSTSAHHLVSMTSKSQKFIEDIQPSIEYKDFSEQYKNVLPEPVDFSFDLSLVEESSGRLQANQLAVDNLTIEWVKNKLSALETKHKECLDNLASNKTNGNKDSSKLPYNELQCEERKLSCQMETIKKALSDLGCEELPSGCDLPGSNLFDESMNTTSRPSLLSTTNLSLISSTQNTIMDVLKKPFRRKSVLSSPLVGFRSLTSAQENSSAKTAPPQLNGQASISSTRSLVEEEWFHGVLPREEVVRLLTKEGDFLVRETCRNDENQTVLSVCWGGHKHFIVQTTAEGEFRFEGPAFPTIQELIQYQYQSGLPVTSRSGAILRSPIPRETWELNNDDVILMDKLGRGNFGDVYKARLRNTNQEVAVKTCRVTVAEEHKRKFLQEGRILKQYDHANIVKLIGICVQKQPIMIVMELVHGGSLLMFLRNNASSLVQKQLLQMCRDAAAGMRYLESKNCIHRDLAARNCLVGKDDIVKISDFGMSREEEEYIVSDGMKQIPIKWTAPEALNFGKYTSLCDVWSYGVLCWEIFSRGGTPYNGLSNTKAREKIDAGYRMPAPESTPDEMYRLMLRCWEYEPEKRPHFDQIFTVVDTLYDAYS
nr:PREDICTED: tyrosine-protein kinase Fer isoform X2 [Bemisia tabaci]